MVDLSLHILDVATNAFKAKATLVKIIIEEKEEQNTEELNEAPMPERETSKEEQEEQK